MDWRAAALAFAALVLGIDDGLQAGDPGSSVEVSAEDWQELAALSIRTAIAAGDPRFVAAAAAAGATPGVCRVCHCIEAMACPGGCAWADATKTICTSCVGAQPASIPAELDATLAAVNGDQGDHAHPDCPCGHPPGTMGPCAGCNCADPCPACDRLGVACVCPAAVAGGAR